MPRGRPKKKVPNVENVEPVITEPVKSDSEEINKYYKKSEYEIQGKVKVMSAMCRQSRSIRGNYYTFEYKEERELPLTNSINLAKEKDDLWYSVNSEVDRQICDLVEWLENQQN